MHPALRQVDVLANRPGETVRQCDSDGTVAQGKTKHGAEQDEALTTDGTKSGQLKGHCDGWQGTKWTGGGLGSKGNADSINGAQLGQLLVHLVNKSC